MYKLDTFKLLLVHPGGPLWAKRDLGAWSIPKGEFVEEDAIIAAKREFYEETGVNVDGEFIKLTPQKLKSGKTIYAWAVLGDLNEKQIKSNLFEMEWPPRSGKKQQFPEVDKAEWFSADLALKKINQGQIGFITELIEKLGIEEPLQWKKKNEGLSSVAHQLKMF